MMINNYTPLIIHLVTSLAANFLVTLGGVGFLTLLVFHLFMNEFQI